MKFLVVLDHSPGLTVLQHSLADSADGLAVTGHTPSEERAVATQMTGDSLLTQHQLLVIRADLTPEQYCVISHPNLTPHTSPVSEESSGQSYDGLSSGVEADCVELEGVNPHLLVGREERKRVSAGKTAKPFFWGTTLTALTITHGRPDNTQVRGQN